MILPGWNKVGKESWTVENSVIHGKGLTNDYGYLETDKPYKDFSSLCGSSAWRTGTAACFFIRRLSLARRT